MRRSWVIGSRAVLAGGLLALSSLGLAYAGVDLPGSAAERAWQAVGLDLPNQGNDGETARADDVKAVIDSSEERGCEFGQDVAEAASDGKSAQDQAKDPCTAEENGDSEAEAQGSKATGEEKSAEGRAKAAEKSNGRSEAGADNAGSNDDAGRQTASEKSDGKSDGGADNAGSNDAATGGSGGETASEKSGGKSDAGPDNAGGGEETASEKAGGSAPDSPGSP